MNRLPEPTMSAIVDGGPTKAVKRACKSCGRKLHPATRGDLCKRCHDNTKRRRIDPVVTKAGGGPMVTVQIGMRAAERDALEVWTRRAQMTRSEFVRRAIARFVSYLEMPAPTYTPPPQGAPK